MSQFNWRNGFAIGLTTGIAASLVLIIYGEELYNLVSCISKSQHCSDAGAYEGNQEPEWWYWTRRVVATEDTLAQWIMAFFTIAATFVLVLTLRSANKTNAAAVQAAQTALEANQIMRQEQRPWLDAENFKLTKIRDDENECFVSWECTLKNHGATPAVNVQVSQNIIEIQDTLSLRPVLFSLLDEIRATGEDDRSWVVFPGDPRGRNGSMLKECGRKGFGRFLFVAFAYDIAGFPLGGADAQVFKIHATNDNGDENRLIPYGMFRVVE